MDDELEAFRYGINNVDNVPQLTVEEGEKEEKSSLQQQQQQETVETNNNNNGLGDNNNNEEDPSRVARRQKWQEKLKGGNKNNNSDSMLVCPSSAIHNDNDISMSSEYTNNNEEEAESKESTTNMDDPKCNNVWNNNPSNNEEDDEEEEDLYGDGSGDDLFPKLPPLEENTNNAVVGNNTIVGPSSPMAISSNIDDNDAPTSYDPSLFSDSPMKNDNSSNNNILLPPSLTSYKNNSNNSSIPVLTAEVVNPATAADDDNKPKTKTISVKRKRATGLGNLGNTCFMNSTLQCLAHTPPLRHYFLSGAYKNDLNADNPLGTGGELAEEFANLLREMWLEEQTIPLLSSSESGSGDVNGDVGGTMVVGDDSNLANGGNNSGSGGNGVYSSSRIYSPGNGGSMHYSMNTTSSYNASAVTYPRSFKTTLGKHASQFIGYDQHDSQELAIYLLDALHEDTNRIRKKPYVEKPEQAADESDEDAASKAWECHKQREDSAVQENFMGLIKSRLVCPKEECGRISTTFDPCMYLSVPIPGSMDRTLKVVFVPLPSALPSNNIKEEGGTQKAAAEVVTTAELTVKLCKNSSLKTLREKVVEMACEAYGYSEEGLREEDVQLADIFRGKVWAFHHELDKSIDHIKDNDITYAYQLYPLSKVKEEVVAYKEKKEKEDEEKKKQTSNSNEGGGSGTASDSSPSSSQAQLDPSIKAELDEDNGWEKKLETFLTNPIGLYSLTNPKRSSEKERTELYCQLLRFTRKCKDCSDATTDEDEKSKGISTSDETMTLEEVSHTSSQFKNVHTPQDLAVLDYCTSKYLALIQELKNGKKEDKLMNENGVVVQIKLHKSDPSVAFYGSTNNTYGSASSKWKLVGEVPLVVRISPTLTVSGLRKMLDHRFSGALKLKTDEHHTSGDDSLPSQELSVMKQVALSCENKARSTTTRFSSNDVVNVPLGTVTLDQLAENPKMPTLANSNDKDEKELVADIVNDESAIVVTWPTHLNDILEEDILSSKAEFWTSEQMKEREENDQNKKKGVSVMDCISKYCEKEQLDETDMWYCSQCKEHVQAWKQFSLYVTPPILIVHLKRFHYSQTTHRRDKIDTLIDFPLTDLDLRAVLKHSNWDQEPLYDCYAVSNHFGGLGGGHYTAYARGDDGSWSNFDDSRVTTGVDESEVVSSAAYCLYYKRKDIVFDKDDDLIMTTSDNTASDEDMLAHHTMIPVSPSPDHHDGTNMEIEEKRDSGSEASFNTPIADGGNMDDGDSTTAIPSDEVDEETYWDAPGQ